MQPAKQAIPQGDLIAREYDGNDRIDYSIKDSAVITQKSENSETEISKGLKEKVRSLFFPSGYPQSVSSDYDNYRKWSAVSNAVNSAINYFSTQTLLTALGIAFPVPAVAAIAWMLKDSLSGAGKFVGSYLAKKVDQDPKKWNVAGETLKIVGSYSTHALALMPGAFLPVAIASQAIKATGETITGAAQANIEKHLATADNIGELKTKNSNQDMVSSGIGGAFAIGLQLLAGATGIGAVGLVAIYAGLTAVNIVAAWKASKALRMDFPNAKNLMKIFQNHAETKKMISPEDLDKATSLAESVKQIFSKEATLGAGIKKLTKNPEMFKEVTTLFTDKNYLLYRHKDRVMVVLRPDADRKDVAEALYCASLVDTKTESPAFEEQKQKLGEDRAVLDILKSSLQEVPSGAACVQELEQAGWKTDKIPLPPGKRADWGKLKDAG